MATTAAIVPSGNPALLERCLLALDKQSAPIERVVVVPWGARRGEVVAVAARHRRVEVVSAGGDSGIAANRNVGIAHLAQSPPTDVAFIDDDLIVQPGWHAAMLDAMRREGPAASATVVLAAERPDVVQGKGHVLLEGRPLHVGYARRRGEDTRGPALPCANSAFVPYHAIAGVAEIEPPFDPGFRRMTCFDFGLKLRLSGVPCRLVEDAVAYHAGYPGLGEDLAPDRVREELTARERVYEKYYPDEERAVARAELARRAARWASVGYPHAPAVCGELVAELVKAAAQAVIGQAASLTPHWRARAAALTRPQRQALLLGRAT